MRMQLMVVVHARLLEVGRRLTPGLLARLGWRRRIKGAGVDGGVVTHPYVRARSAS
jgi:hypothetical protein